MTAKIGLFLFTTKFVVNTVEKQCADGFGAKIGTVLFSKVEKSRQLRRNPGITSGANESLSKFTSMRMTLFF